MRRTPTKRRAPLGTHCPRRSASSFSAPPRPAQQMLLVLVGAWALGVALGAVLGAVQATQLRGLVRLPRRWVFANAAAWAPAMAIIVGATTPGRNWNGPAVSIVGAVTGLVARAVLGLITG